MSAYDGVIEAVRYKGNKIDCVRAYERRGAAFSDRVLIDRARLIASLELGRRFVTGQRTEFMAGTFEVGRAVVLSGRNGDRWVTTGDGRARDGLEGVPLF